MTSHILLSIASILSAPETGVAPLPIAHDAGWAVETTGRFEAWFDRRDLLVLAHPWEESESGKSASAGFQTVAPEGSPGPLALYFYMADDYDGQGEHLKDTWLGQINLPGHRFKQVLVNGEVVWERDVADADGPGQPHRFEVPLPESIKAGDKATITFRVVDKVGSGTRLENDFRFIGTTDNINEDEPWRFWTRVYVGDAALAPAGTDVPQSGAPYAAAVREMHERRWPLAPTGDPSALPAALGITGKRLEGLTPLHCGVPLPPGVCTDLNAVRLTDLDGDALPLQVSEMNRWPDGSVRWVEVGTVLPSGAEEDSYRLSLVPDGTSRKPEMPSGVRVKEEASGGVTLTAGKLELTTGNDPSVLFESLANGSMQLTGFQAEVVVEGAVYRPVVRARRVLACGPVRGEVELEGTLDTDTASIGPFVCRASIHAGQPFVRLTWRFFNKAGRKLEIGGMRLFAASPMGDNAVARLPGSAEQMALPLAMQQVSPERFEVRGGGGEVVREGTQAPDGLSIVSEAGTLTVALRYLAEQHPASLGHDGQKLELGLFAPSEEAPLYEPNEGEAKRHEVWLALWPDDPGAAAADEVLAFFDHPPTLFDAGYFCASGGLGQAFPHDEERFPRLTRFMDTAHAGKTAADFHETGIRHWGDLPYNAKEGTWRNGYYDMQQGFAAEYLMTGETRWFGAMEGIVRHIIDVDVCHASENHPDWVGGIHGYYGPNHSTEAPWFPQQRTKGTLAYWRYTCDRDARDAALGLGDWAARTGAAVGSTSVRAHAGVLYGLAAACDETHDAKYRDAARKLAHDAMTRIDRRRGCYAEIHGNVSYRGNVPWMCAQLAEPLYDYYRQTGDLDAAIAVVGLAESILAENRTRGVPGDVFGYSHNPHFKKTSGYHILIAPAVMYAYELTGDPYFLENARAMYEQTIRENTVNSIMNCYWNTPALLYYLDKYTEKEQKP